MSVTEAVNQGHILISGKPTYGYSETVIHVVNLKSFAVDVDFSTVYCFQSNTTQRLGLAYEYTTGTYYLRLAANATYDLTFSSRCLDHTLSGPARDVPFASFIEIRPEFGAITAALRANASQSEVWSITNGSGALALAWQNTHPRLDVAAHSELEISGAVAWKAKKGKLTIKMARLTNLNPTEYSGNLRIRVWATHSPYTGEATNGYILGTYQLSPLRAGYYFKKLVMKTGFATPPPGVYYTTVTVEEEVAGRWVVVDYSNMSRTSRF